MLKKIAKIIIATLGILTGLTVSLILLLDWKEEWLYKKFGKEKVLDFMKRFEPFITMEPDKYDDGEESAQEVNEDTEEASEEIEEAEADEDKDEDGQFQPQE